MCNLLWHNNDKTTYIYVCETKINFTLESAVPSAVPLAEPQQQYHKQYQQQYQ